MTNPKTRIWEIGNKKVMFNSLHGKPLIPTEGLIRLLETFKEPRDQEDIIKTVSQKELRIIEDLVSMDFLINPLKDVYEKVKEREKQELNNNLEGLNLYNLRLNVTSSCNLACQYCYVYQRKEEISSFKNMSTEIAEKSISLFFKFLKEKEEQRIQTKAIPKIRYFGGEPLINFPVVKRSVELTSRLAEQYNIKVQSIINTNGTIYDQEIEKFLLSNQDLNLIISWDGLGDYHDLVRHSKNNEKSSKKIMKNFERMMDQGIRPTISCVLSERNKDHLKEFIDYLAEKKLKYFGISVQTVSQTGDKMSSEEKAKRLIEVMSYAKEKGIEVDGPWSWQYRLFNDNTEVSYCGAVGGEIHVSENGTAHPCHLVKLKYGDITKIKKLEELFVSQEYKTIINRTISAMYDDCNSCDLEGLCAGGCMAESYERTGDYSKRGEGCEFKVEMTKQLLEKYLEEMD
ncbi:radical SAM protein [Candidatus Woesearchaeota archaeon]|jgi:uncharacterized protein|nr:radical SAM protein [Candidatus Woesearchaeota archaeon]MBT4111244.1 radical SAM protein [Candidatus Woesearchaeota archaeon]MBT4336824.1 radical SAM protein [Candidatus Woesearchaeota archaeon]MBT4469492.1 radical SAM protein [Candidatus Woesearchaeota archaeon]MBT6744113.1 radical SAM protein [Candidatus Woesearchaeota archaeon]